MVTGRTAVRVPRLPRFLFALPFSEPSSRTGKARPRRSALPVPAPHTDEGRGVMPAVPCPGPHRCPQSQGLLSRQRSPS